MTFDERKQEALDFLRTIFPTANIILVIAVNNNDGAMIHVGSTTTREDTEFVFRSLLGDEEGTHELN